MNKAKKITISEKLFEFLEAMSKNNNKLIGQNSNLKFSDNTNMNQFWNNNRETIIDLIKTNKEYSKRYNDSCEVLINLYSKYKKRKIKVKTISFEDKLLEFLEAMHKNNNNIILTTSKLKFSDGVFMNQFLKNNREKIYTLITTKNNIFIKKYPKCCENIINDYMFIKAKSKDISLTDEERLIEYLIAMSKNNNKLIKQTSNLRFSDGISMRYYWNIYKEKIIKLLSENMDKYLKDYKEACKTIIDAYKEYKNYLIKKENNLILDFNRKLLEYLKAMNKNNNKIINQRSNIKFSDGTNMGSFFNNNREKIYEELIKDNNKFLKKYPASCMTLIKKCEGLFEQRREKRKNYIMNKRKFREESSFDKTLSNEKEINKKTGVYI